MIRLTDEQWERIRMHFPEEHISDCRPGRKLIPTRRVLEAVLWIHNTGAQWHMLPQSYPNYKTVHRNEVLRRVLTDVANELRDRGALDEAECFIASRPAKVGDKLTTHDFGTGTRGFAASEDMNVAVCVLPRVLAFNLNLSPLDEAEKNPRILRLCRRGKAPIKSSQQLRVRR